MALALTGCATTGPGAYVEPLRAASLKDTVEVRQRVLLQRGDQRRVAETVLRTDAEQAVLVGFGPGGQRAFTLSWSQDEMQWSTQGDVMDALPPRILLADLQLAFWPLADLQGRLPPGLRLEQHGRSRLLWKEDELIWWSGWDAADRWHSEMLVYNGRFGYRLRVQSKRMQGKP